LFVVPVFLFLAATSQANTSTEAQQKSGFVRLDRVTASRAISNGIEIRSGLAVMQITAALDCAATATEAVRDEGSTAHEASSGN